MNPLGALSGLGAAACWGVAVFGGGLASRRASVLTTVIIGDITGTLLALAVAVLTSERLAGPIAWAWATAAGLSGLVGAFAFLRAISLNPIGLITPIGTMVGAGVPVVFSLAMGEQLSTTKGVGIVAALVAVVLVSLPTRERALGRRALAQAVVAGICWGGFYIGMNEAANSGASTWWPIVASRSASALAAIGVALVSSRLVARREASLLMVGSGAMDVAGTAMFLFASSQSSLGIAAVTSSMYPAVTALLARAVLHEHLAQVHLAGIVLALVGIVLIALP
jgi:drug/metabolite transporter (DMT)-like permease